MLTPLEWRVLELGRIELRFRTPAGDVVTLEWAHGGGYAKSLGLWRVRRRLAMIVAAGDA